MDYDYRLLPWLPLELAKQAPQVSCVYLCICGDRVVYIGQTGNLRQRWAGGHHQMLNLCTRYDPSRIRVYYHVIKPEHACSSFLRLFEDTLIEMFKPVLNAY